MDMTPAHAATGAATVFFPERDISDMEQNVGSTDRLARIVIGIAVLAVAIALFAGIGGVSGTIGTVVGPVVLAIVGAVLVVTGYLQTCPAYRVIGFETLGR